MLFPSVLPASNLFLEALHIYLSWSDLAKEGFAVSITNVYGQDNKKEKYMLFMEINKKSYEQLEKLINELDPKAFTVVNETKLVQNGFIK